MPSRHLAACAAALCLVVFARRAGATDPPRHLLEAEALVTFSEHMKAVPLTLFGGGLEIGVGSYVGLRFAGLGIAAPRDTLDFLEESAVGGGAAVSVRFYPRARWPRGFGAGVSATVVAVAGLGGVFAYAEVFYRFLLRSRIALRLQGTLGMVSLWDASETDERPGPPLGRINGASMGIGLAGGFTL